MYQNIIILCHQIQKSKWLLFLETIKVQNVTHNLAKIILCCESGADLAGVLVSSYPDKCYTVHFETSLLPA